jgi:hypothetical protein
MSLSAVLASVPAAVRRHEATFQRARASEPAFAPYATAAALLESACLESALPIPERQAVVAAIVRQHQATRHPLWQAVLLRAFRPMLLTLHERDRGTKEERDQRVLLAFLQTIATVSPTGPVFVKVPWATARALFGAVRDEAGAVEEVFLDEGTPECVPSPHTDPQPFVACLAREVAERLARRQGGEDIVRVLIGAETPAEQAERLHATSTAAGESSERASLECMRQRRKRVLDDLREELRRVARAPRRRLA